MHMEPRSVNKQPLCDNPRFELYNLNQVYGIEWKTPYSVYTRWNNTKKQHAEMIAPGIVRRLQRCCV